MWSLQLILYKLQSRVKFKARYSFCFDTVQQDVVNESTYIDEVFYRSSRIQLPLCEENIFIYGCLFSNRFQPESLISRP